MSCNEKKDIKMMAYYFKLPVVACFCFLCSFVSAFHPRSTSSSPSFDRRNKLHNDHSGGKTIAMKMMEMMDDSNYHQVLQGGKDDNKAVLVDCCAVWCGPCKLIEPVLDRSSKKWSSRLDVVKFDVDGGNNKNTKLELLLQGVMPRALPSLILFREGKAIAKHQGVITDEGLDEFLEENIPVQIMQKKKDGAGYVSFAGKLDERDSYMLSGPM